jgi:hypothetical protein
MQDLSTTFDAQPSEDDSDGKAPGSACDPNVSNPEASQPRYEIRGGKLYRVESNKEACLANFYLEIVAQHIRIDEGVPIRRYFLVPQAAFNLRRTRSVPVEYGMENSRL